MIREAQKASAFEKARITTCRRRLNEYVIGVLCSSGLKAGLRAVAMVSAFGPFRLTT